MAREMEIWRYGGRWREEEKEIAKGMEIEKERNER